MPFFTLWELSFVRPFLPSAQVSPPFVVLSLSLFLSLSVWFFFLFVGVGAGGGAGQTSWRLYQRQPCISRAVKNTSGPQKQFRRPRSPFEFSLVQNLLYAPLCGGTVDIRCCLFFWFVSGCQIKTNFSKSL